MAKELPNEDLGRPINYDPDFHGPLKRRSCTDIICLLLFLVFVGGWVAVGIWAIKNGEPRTLLVPRDSTGRRCGLDEDVQNMTYLFFFDLTKCLDPTTPFVGCDTKQVCVEKCPDKLFYNDGSMNTSIALPYCLYDHRTSYDTTNCPVWLLPSESVQKRCIPSLGKIDADTWAKLKEFLNDLYIYNTLVGAIDNIKLLSEAQQMAELAIADIINSWWKILIGIGLALLVSLIYILLLRWIAGIMVWISIAGALAALGAGAYFSYDAWQTWSKKYNEDGLSSMKTKQNIFLALFIILVVVLSIILLVLIFLRKRIALAVALIKEGSKAVSSVTSVLFFPILPWIMQIGVVAYAIVTGVCLATTGEPIYRYRYLTNQCSQDTGWTVQQQCWPNTFDTSAYPSCTNASCTFVEIANEAYYPYLQAINIFGFFWLAFFVSALGQMVLAQVFAQWYWTMKKRTLPFFALTAAFYRTVRYHLGTLAFGSLIIAICRMIRLCLEYIDRKLKQYDNQFTKAIMCCLKCFFWCLENFLKFINKNAYIMCAIHGKNFCASAKDAFMLLMRNIIRVFVLDKVTDFVFFLSKLLVTAGVGAVAYIFFGTDMIMNNSDLNYGIVPVVVIMIVTYLIATLFFSVYSMAVDTLFLCFLEDCERNDGKSKPYYMSRNLMKIFGKKNKGPKYE